MGYVEDLRAIIGHRPVILVGAVVIISDRAGRLLLQQRLHPYGQWAFPGGLMELGESTEDTARQEVFEETGLSVGRLDLIDVFSGSDNFIKAPNGDEFFTVTAAYSTSEVSGELKVDRTESLDFQFFERDGLPDRIVRSHRVILDRYLSKL
jgi:8-oxo-dGTP pyrophosphatase MutT (NUDIX family)